MRCRNGLAQSMPHARQVICLSLAMFIGFELVIQVVYLSKSKPVKPLGQQAPAPAPTSGKDIDCARALSLRSSEQLIAEYGSWQPERLWTNDELRLLLNDCKAFRRQFPFHENPLSTAEAAMPLAYAALVHDYAENVVRLLQALLRPNTVIAITYDNKASDAFKGTMHRLARCFPNNILLADKQISVSWGHSSIMEAYLNALERLLEHHSLNPWRYVQMITASDFPLKTNQEMVQIFNVLNGSLDVELIKDTPARHRYVWETTHEQTAKPSNWTDPKRIRFGRFYRTDQQKQPPAGVRLYRGSVATALNFDFVNWTFHNPVAKELRSYLSTAMHSEESFVATLAHNPGLDAPGAFPGECVEEYDRQQAGWRKPWYARYTVWPEAQSSTRKCTGRMVRGSCQSGIGDLPDLIARPHLFAHKVGLDYQPALLYCLTAELRRRRQPTSPTLTSTGNDGSDEQQLASWLRTYAHLPQVAYAKLGKSQQNRTLTQVCGLAMDPSA